jgi:hypothetical protein
MPNIAFAVPLAAVYYQQIEMHTWAEYHNGDGISGLLPGDVTYSSPNYPATGNAPVNFQLANVPPYSSIRIDVYSSTNGTCALCGTSGYKVIVDAWITPYIGGTYYPEKYLGYVILQHLRSGFSSGTHYATANSAASVLIPIGHTWGAYGDSPVYCGTTLCWTGPHVHAGCSRDPGLESAYGTYTTGVYAVYGSGVTSGPLGTGQGIYYWSVTY